MENFIKKLFFLPRNYKIVFFVILDFSISIFSIWSSFCLRLGEIYDPLKIDIKLYLIPFVIFVLIQITFKSYYQLSRFFRISSINNLVRNFTLLFIFLCLIRLFFLGNIFFPQSITFIYPIIFFLLSLFKNSLTYNLYHYINDHLKSSNRRVLFYNFNNKTINYLENYNKTNFIICGIVKLSENFLKGYDKKYRIIEESEIENYAKQQKITDIIISEDNNYDTKIFYFRKFLNINVRVLFLDDVTNNRELLNVRSLFIPKVEDIIEKSQTRNKADAIIEKKIKDKVVLVAGGAGSIGSVLIEKLNTLSPKKIIVIDKDEYNIFNLKKKFHYSAKLIFKLSDTSNKKFLEEIFREFKPDIVYNAAAYKHVTIVEENIEYACINNIVTSINICELSKKYNVKISLLVSTDKAVNPKNIMGITKSLCEKVYQSYSYNLKHNQKFIIVRFGNVAGSKGSVLPFFQKLINQRMTLPVTNKKATRYLMSIREASNLIIKASIIGSNTKTYVLDMGDPINIYNLAYKLIKFNGLSLKTKNNIRGDIGIKIVGLKKGEKLHEKLTYKNNLIKTDYHKILLCNEKLVNPDLKLKISKYISKIKLNLNKKIKKIELINLLKN